MRDIGNILLQKANKRFHWAFTGGRALKTKKKLSTEQFGSTDKFASGAGEHPGNFEGGGWMSFQSIFAPGDGGLISSIYGGHSSTHFVLENLFPSRERHSVLAGRDL